MERRAVRTQTGTTVPNANTRCSGLTLCTTILAPVSHFKEKIWKSYREGDTGIKEREICPLVLSPNGQNDQVWARMKPAASSGLSLRWRGLKSLDHLPLLFPGHWQGSRSKVACLGRELIPVWNAWVMNSGFTHNIIIPTPTPNKSL